MSAYPHHPRYHGRHGAERQDYDEMMDELYGGQEGAGGGCERCGERDGWIAEYYSGFGFDEWDGACLCDDCTRDVIREEVQRLKDRE